MSEPQPQKPVKVRRERLDVLLVSQGHAPSRERARAVILAGEVRVNGALATKAGMPVAEDATIELSGASGELRYASRGGLKLEHALDAFGLDPSGLVCLDVGASTGGFTDVLLRRGAHRVYALDVGHGQLVWSLRRDPRVVVMERTNIRHIKTLPEPISATVIDVSFISLRPVLPRVSSLLAPDGWVVALLKPQFEAGKAEVDRTGGVLLDPAIHRRVVTDFLAWLDEWPSEREGPPLIPVGLAASPIRGRDGNREYLVALRQHGMRISQGTVEAVLAEAFAEPPGA